MKSFQSNTRSFNSAGKFVGRSPFQITQYFILFTSGKMVKYLFICVASYMIAISAYEWLAIYAQAQGPFVVYCPIGRQCPKIEPWKAIAHSIELNPIMFTAVYSVIPSVIKAFANLSASLWYCLYVRDAQCPGLSYHVKAVLFGYFYKHSCHSWMIVQGSAEPGPDFLTLTGNSTLQSSVHRKFLLGFLWSQCWQMYSNPLLEMLMYQSPGSLGRVDYVITFNIIDDVK